VSLIQLVAGGGDEHCHAPPIFGSIVRLDNTGRFTEEQIIKVLKEHAAGLSVSDLCRKRGISDATFYKWRSPGWRSPTPAS